MKTALLTLGFFSLMTLVSCGPAGSGGSKSAPKKVKATPAATGIPVEASQVFVMEQSHIVKFADLPLEGKVEEGDRLWSGDSWPLNQGSINKRWNTPEQVGFDTVSPTKDELLLLTADDVSRLSPSEKLDILLGHYDYPLKAEVSKKINPVALAWESIGNGWAAATSNHNEPKPKVLTNPDGLSVPFGSADIKALVSYYYAFSPKLPFANYLGIRCFDPATNDCVNDLNAGSFHVLLANKIGIKKESFVADIDRNQEVWNYPFVGFKSEVLEEKEPDENAFKGTKKVLDMKTSVKYVDKALINSWEATKPTDQVITSRVYNYSLYLNKDGKIIGGEWKTADRPDFIWIMPTVKEFDGDFAALSQLLE